MLAGNHKVYFSALSQLKCDVNHISLLLADLSISKAFSILNLLINTIQQCVTLTISTVAFDRYKYAEYDTSLFYKIGFPLLFFNIVCALLLLFKTAHFETLNVSAEEENSNKSNNDTEVTSMRVPKKWLFGGTVFVLSVLIAVSIAASLKHSEDTDNGNYL